ncbi:MAG TPA: BatD family protein [Lacipirellulaceae bacterium]|jgi:tetratricopeptide (TPR) repeat protein|nr:BatD family protein [Lacipirellulaceae bacterium]
MNHHLRINLAILAIAFAAAAAQEAQAATVRVGLSTRETFVGAPVTLSIQVASAKNVTPPTLPAVDGLTIKSLGEPSRSTQIMSVNGHTTTTTTQVFAFEVTPQRGGTFQIPAITIHADGIDKQTRPLEFVASKSETGDLMFVEIAGKEKEIYVGQALHLTLKIVLRPYTDVGKKITLSEGDMWKMISERSEWGPFAERMQLYADQGRRPSGTEVLRKDHDGTEHNYYQYEIEATIYPKRPGKIDGDNVKIIADYPTAIGKARDPFAGFFDDMQLPGGRPPGFGDDDLSMFGSRLVVQSVRPVVGRAAVEPINVLPIPTADRPADYRGAVGTYHIAVDASPTHVKAGDPINLFIGISGTGPMELVQAPPLAEVPALSADFKAPNEPLAGFVKGDRKIFQTTIRPRKQGITQIPPIPFSFFDPTAGKFVTVQSGPISVQVDKAEMLALDGIAATTKEKDSSPTGSRAATAGSSTSLAVFTGDDVLNTQTVWSPNRILWLLLFAAPPIGVFALFLSRREDLSHLSYWFSSASHELKSALANASGTAEVGAALKRYARHIYQRKGATADAESITGALRASGARDLAIRFETLLNECSTEYCPELTMSDEWFADLKLRAQQWASDVQSFSRRSSPKPNPRPNTQAKRAQITSVAKRTSLVSLAMTIASTLFVGQISSAAEAPHDAPTTMAVSSETIILNEQQQKAVLAEASAAYSTALDKLDRDAADAKIGFERAAEKYQLLVNSGIKNSRLYYNLANACLESGQIGKAVVNYHRALRIEPTFREAQSNLAQAELQLHPSNTANAQQSPRESLAGFATISTRWLLRNIAPLQVLAAMALAWLAFWAAIAGHLLGYRFPWKSSALTLASVAILLAVAFWQISPIPSQQLAVVVQAERLTAPGSQERFDVGQVVEVLQQRPDTVRVRASDGQESWLPADSVNSI